MRDGARLRGGVDDLPVDTRIQNWTVRNKLGEIGDLGNSFSSANRNTSH
jgi:hypothetical protein